MKIAVLTNDYPPRARGGAGVVAETYVVELEKRGHELKVEVVHPTWLDRPFLIRALFHLFDLSPRRDVVQRVLAWKPDILLTHNLTGCGFGTPRLIKATGIPWVHVLHDVQLVDPFGKVASREFFHLGRQLIRWITVRARQGAFGHPSLIISPTEWLLRFHRQWGFFQGSKTAVVPNPVVMTSDAKPSLEERSLDSARDERQGILFVGRVDRDKGIDVLIEAWKGLGEARPPLHVIGAGGAERHIRALKDGRVLMHGPQSGERVRQMMRRAKVLAVPSLIMENQPTVILEGLAAGCSVVASNVGGIPETLGDAGKIVPAGNVAAWTNALREVTDDRLQVTGDGRSTSILSRHRVEVAASALESFLKSNL